MTILNSRHPEFGAITFDDPRIYTPQGRDGWSGEPAPEGKLWVCQACGRKATDRYAFPDSSCFMNARLAASPAKENP